VVSRLGNSLRTAFRPGRRNMLFEVPAYTSHLWHRLGQLHRHAMRVCCKQRAAAQLGWDHIMSLTPPPLNTADCSPALTSGTLSASSTAQGDL
jgi:hypothetical protein